MFPLDHPVDHFSSNVLGIGTGADTATPSTVEPDDAEISASCAAAEKMNAPSKTAVSQTLSQYPPAKAAHTLPFNFARRFSTACHSFIQTAR